MKILEDQLNKQWINRDRKGNPGPDTRFNTVQSITRESPNLEKIVNIILMLRFIKEGGQHQRRRIKELQYFMVGGIEKKEVNIGQIAAHSTSYLDAVNILIENGAIKRVMVLHPAKDGKVNKIIFYKYLKELDVEKAISDLEVRGNRSVRGDTLERYNKAKEILNNPASYNELYEDAIVNYTKEFDRATGAFVVTPGHDDFGQDKKEIAEKLASFIKSKGQIGAKRIEMAKYLIDNVLPKEEAVKWDAKNTNLTSKYDRYLIEKLGIFRIGSRFVSKEFLPDNADQISEPTIDSDKSEPTIDKIDDVTPILEPSNTSDDDVIEDSVQESYIIKQKRKLLESYANILSERKKKLLVLEDDNKVSWGDYADKNPMLKASLEVLDILSKYGKAYIVGGAVRDIIMNKEPHDIDIATEVSLEKIEELFGKTMIHDIGASKDFGIVTLNYKGFTYEIAQFRKDSYIEPDYVQKIL